MASASAPERYALIGHPVAHSLSPLIHGQFARATGATISYELIDAAPLELAARLAQFFAAGGSGLNVTVPYKQAVLPLIDRLSERASTAGAVNTLRREPDGRLYGDNTDGIGLVRDLTEHLHCPLAGQRLLLLGSGGAARGVLAPLLALGPRALLIANRTAERAHTLAREFAALGPVQGSGYEALGEEPFELIINATAASLEAAVPPVPSCALGAGTVCYDLGYAREATAFMRWARTAGVAHVHSGLGMLIEQAAESFYLWRGVRPDTAPVRAALGIA